MGEVWIEDIFRFFLLLFWLFLHLVTFAIRVGFTILIAFTIFCHLLILNIVIFVTNTTFNIGTHNKTSIKFLNTRHLIIIQLLIKFCFIEFTVLELLVERLTNIGLLLATIYATDHGITTLFSVTHVNALYLCFTLSDFVLFSY